MIICNNFKWSQISWYTHSDLFLQVVMKRKDLFRIHHLKSILPSVLDTLMGPQRRQWHPTPVLLPGKSHGWMSLVGCSPWGHKESGMTERLHFHFSLSCMGDGNGNPLQCFCLENPRDGGAWWAVIYGITQSRTRLNRLSSSSSKDVNVLITQICEYVKVYDDWKLRLLIRWLWNGEIILDCQGRPNVITSVL